MINKTLTTKLTFLICGVLLTLSIANPPSAARPAASIIFTQPDGVDDVVGEGDDFATTVLGDPWDMSEHTDILYHAEVPDLAIGGGILSFTTTDAQKRFSPLFQGINGPYPMSREGVNYPINTDQYHWLSFRMRLSQDSVAYFSWFYDQTFTKFATSNPVTVYGGDGLWHTYVIDLKALGTSGLFGGATGWDEQPVGLAIQPAFTAGILVEVDWVRLTADNPAGNSLPISWSDLSPAGGTLELYLDTDNSGYDGVLIHSMSSASDSGSVNWGEASGDVAAPSNFVAGDYYVYALINGEQAGYASAALTIDAAPILEFTQPSYFSGDDYATTERGDGWDMNQAGDIDSVAHGSYSFESGLLKIMNESLSDMQVLLSLGPAIDSKYHYFTYRMLLDYPLGVSNVGQFARLFWGQPDNIATQSELQFVYSGWQTYQADLRQLWLDWGTPWQPGSWSLFRLDPNCNISGQTMTTFIDYVMITADPTGKTNSRVPIRYELSETEGAVVTLYYDTDTSPGGETPIVEYTSPTPSGPNFVYIPIVIRNYPPPDLPGPSGDSVVWDTTGVPAGSYYILAEVSDGYNTTRWYSKLPFILTD